MENTTNGAPPKKKVGCLKIVLIVLGVLILLGVIGSMMEPPATDGTKSEAVAEAEGTAAAQGDDAVEVTAQELFAAYEANEMAAQQTYGKKTLKVTGTISGIQLDFMNDPIVLLRTPNEFMHAQASLDKANKPKAAELAKGQKIVLLCKGVSEVVGTPMLKDCAIQ